jgi:AraC-like DNA-binding protein
MLFPKIVGKPLKQYISERRIKQAVCLSNEQDLSLQEIAAIVGYEDYSTFFRNFHKIVGISPIQYRNNKIEKGQNPTADQQFEDESMRIGSHLLLLHKEQ